MTSEVDAQAAKLQAAFNKALEMVTGAMKLLVDNNIEPVAEQQHLALRWGLGEISDEEFITMARAVAQEHGNVQR